MLASTGLYDCPRGVTLGCSPSIQQSRGRRDGVIAGAQEDDRDGELLHPERISFLLQA